MSDNLKVANGDFESVWVNFTYVDMRQCAEFFWKVGIASQQAAHDAEIARLKEEYDECRADHQKITLDLLDRLSAANAACAMKDAALKAVDSCLSFRDEEQCRALRKVSEALSASPQQVYEWERKQLEPLRAQVAMLRSGYEDTFKDLEVLNSSPVIGPSKAIGMMLHRMVKYLDDTQATAEQFIADIRLQAFEDIVGLNDETQIAMMNELRATSKKAG